MTETSTAERVLVVDDDQRSRRLVSETLRNAGYFVVEAVDGEHALRELGHPVAQFHLAVLDILMPGTDGCMLAREIRRGGRWNTLPLLALTALTNPDDVTRILESGCNAYLSKPVLLAEVRTTVALLIADSNRAHGAVG